MEITAALALATQGATAWYCAEEATTIYPGERVLITAAAGGVGSLLVQLAKRRGAKVYGIVSSPERAAIAQSLGADVALNRRTGDVFRQFREQEGKKSIDIMYDSAGGSYVRKAMSQLAPGGRTLCYGGAQATHARTIFSLLPFALSFGLYHPVPFLMQSQSLIGVNMLRIADHKPDVLQVCLSNIMETYRNGQVKPLPGKTYPVTQLGNAHQALEQGQVPGKIAVRW
jgi:NADPH2:quinone reductase